MSRDLDMREGPNRFHGAERPRRVVNELPAGPVTDGTATLRLYDPIDSWGGEWGVSAKEFAAALDQLPADVHTIELHLNSPGGEVFDGVAILNALRSHPARVVGVVDGIAASAASFIAVGCDELVMGANAELMIHDARGVCVGNGADMQAMADLLGHLSDNIARVYAAKAGGTVDDWRAAMSGESWFSADEAVAAGLADRVATDTPKATNTFDLTMFNHAGRTAAPAPKVTRSDVDSLSAALTDLPAKIAAALGDTLRKNVTGDISQQHVYIETGDAGTCDVCGMAEADNGAHITDSTTAPVTLRHRMTGRRYHLPV